MLNIHVKHVYLPGQVHRGGTTRVKQLVQIDHFNHVITVVRVEKTSRGE